MPSLSFILSVALASSCVPLSSLSRCDAATVQRKAGPSEAISATLSELRKLMKTKLHEDKVIPEVIMDVPEQPVAVFYPHAAVMMGNHIDPVALRYVPQFFFGSKPDRFYTVMLVGPDYPTRDAPNERNRLLWFVTNFARNDTYTLRPIGLVSYKRPQPRSNSGKMRFVFLVYEQSTNRDWSKSLVETPPSTTNFMLEWYVDRNGLTLVAVNYFVIDTEQEGNSSITDRSLGRVTDEEIVAVTGDGQAGTGGNSSDTGEMKAGNRENVARIDEEVTYTGEKLTRTNETHLAKRKLGRVKRHPALARWSLGLATDTGGKEEWRTEKRTDTGVKESSISYKETGAIERRAWVGEKAIGAEEAGTA